MDAKVRSLISMLLRLIGRLRKSRHPPLAQVFERDDPVGADRGLEHFIDGLHGDVQDNPAVKRRLGHEQMLVPEREPTHLRAIDQFIQLSLVRS